NTVSGFHNYTALMLAALFGRVEVVKLLLSAGADINAVSANYNFTALMIAAKAGKIDVVKALAAAGANIDAVDSNDQTILMNLSFYGKIEEVKALIAVGANVNAIDKKGYTALTLAAREDESNQTEVVKALLKAGADTSNVSRFEKWDRYTSEVSNLIDDVTNFKQSIVNIKNSSDEIDKLHQS